MLDKKKLALAVSSVTALLSSTAFAQEAGAGGANAFNVQAAAAALEGISRNPGAAPRIQTPMILGLALIESLVLFAFAVSFLLYSKIP